MAYASSIGGIATPVGSTPNILSLGLLQETINLRVGFMEWILYAFPISLTFLGILYFLSINQINKLNVEFTSKFVKSEYEALARINRNEIITLSIFALTIAGWLLPSISKLIVGVDVVNLNAGAVVMLTSSTLFLFGGEKKILKAQDKPYGRDNAVP